MIVINNPFGQDLIDFNEETAADRIGKRIRDIRTAKGITQAELGEMIGLNADRVQKYENGFRKPKLELLKQIAEALGVEPLALEDPVVSNHFGVMYAFFEMEKLYDLKIKLVDNQIILFFGDGTSGPVNEYLREWEKERRQVEDVLNNITSENEKSSIKYNYNMWEWSFPKALTEKTEKELKAKKRARLQEKIDLLQQELSSLDDD